MSRKMRIRRSSAAMANDPYTLIVALDAQVWGWGLGCPGMGVGLWMPRYGGGALDAQVWGWGLGCPDMILGLGKRRLISE